MSSYKIENKWNTFFKREEPSHSYNQTIVQSSNQNYTKSSAWLCLRFMVLRLHRLHFSTSALCSIDSFFLGSSQLYFMAAAILACMILESPKCWGLHCNWAALSPMACWPLQGLYPTTGWHASDSPLSLKCSLQLHLYLHKWPVLTSHIAKFHLLFMTPLCLQNQYYLGES